MVINIIVCNVNDEMYSQVICDFIAVQIIDNIILMMISFCINAKYLITR